MGLSHVCVQYDLDGPVAGRTRLGRLDLPYRIESQLVEGRLRRLLVVDWPSTSAGATQLLLEAHYGFRVEHLRNEGPPAYEAFLVEDVRGGWLRRWGVHRPDAFVFWASMLDGPAGTLPDAPLVGVRIYIPGLHLELPVLPDIALDDLRALDLPTPFLALSSFRDGRLPAWLAVDGRMNLRDWRGVGPVPAAVQQRFPDR
jgi:hypothetical protein